MTDQNTSPSTAIAVFTFKEDETLYYTLGMPIAFLVVAFFVSLPGFLLKKDGTSLSFRYWLHHAPIEALIYQTIRRPYLREKIFDEVKKRKVGEVHKLLEMMKDKRYPLSFRLQSLLALSEHSSEIAIKALLAATFLDPSLKHTSLIKLRHFPAKKVVKRMIQMLQEPQTHLSYTLIIQTLEWVVKGRNLPLQQLGEKEFQA
ncbi:MAG: hypothetical protein D6785_14310, partial [Planctomycetota bacterium]